MKLPDELRLPKSMQQPPWNFTDEEAFRLVGCLLDELRLRGAMNLPEGSTIIWDGVSPNRKQRSFGLGRTGKPQECVAMGIIRHLLP